MLKKLIALLLVFVLTFALAACGDSNTPDNSNNPTQDGSQSGTNNTSDIDNDVTNTEVNLTQTLTFMGYNISYPEDASKDPSDYGNLIGNSNYILIVEAPAIAGKTFNVTNISDAPSACEEYIAHTLEHKMRSVFDDGSTSQKIDKTTEVTYNGIKMLLTEGTFTNDRNNTTVEFSAIYLLAGDNGNLPVYIVGVPMVDGFDVASVVETVAENIKK